MKTVYRALDGEEFESKEDCELHEQKYKPCIPVPIILFEQMLEQCTPYLVPAKERYALKSKLQEVLTNYADGERP